MSQNYYKSALEQIDAAERTPLRGSMPEMLHFRLIAAIVYALLAIAKEVRSLRQIIGGKY